MTPRNRQIQSETAKRSYKQTNDILEDHGDWLLVDISTSKHPNAQMAVDKDVWDRREGGRVGAIVNTAKYIYARYHIDGVSLPFHNQPIQKVVGLEVDHIKHGSMTFVDNRRSNLRNVTRAQNNMNRGAQSSNKSGIIGVTWSKRDGKWLSRIKIDGKEKFLGSFADKADAIAARKAAEEKYFGEYAFKSGAAK